MQSFWQKLVFGMMRRDLRRAYRRVLWVGEPPALPPDVPVVLYANHHGFFDAHLAWIAVEHFFGRPVMTWMADWDRFSVFSEPSGRSRFRWTTRSGGRPRCGARPATFGSGGLPPSWCTFPKATSTRPRKAFSLSTPSRSPA